MSNNTHVLNHEEVSADLSAIRSAVEQISNSTALWCNACSRVKEQTSELVWLNQIHDAGVQLEKDCQKLLELYAHIQRQLDAQAEEFDAYSKTSLNIE